METPAINDLHDRSMAELLRENQERAVDEMRRILAVELFRSSPFYQQITVSPPTWKTRFQYRWRRLQQYLATLWCALRGDELVAPCDCSDW